MSSDQSQIIRKKPPRIGVLFESNADTAAKALADPGEWLLVAGDDATYERSIRQTAYAIRKGHIKAFSSNGGTFETKVASRKNFPELDHDIEMYLRWVPHSKE